MQIGYLCKGWIRYQELTWWLSNEGLNEHPGCSTSTAGMSEGLDIWQKFQVAKLSSDQH